MGIAKIAVLFPREPATPSALSGIAAALQTVETDPNRTSPMWIVGRAGLTAEPMWQDVDNAKMVPRESAA